MNKPYYPQKAGKCLTFAPLYPIINVADPPGFSPSFGRMQLTSVGIFLSLPILEAPAGSP